MDHPVKEIRPIIKSLTQGTPAEQQQTLETYFPPDATFAHPFCRVPSIPTYALPFLPDTPVNSRLVILFIYRWYRILSPRIDVDISSAVHDQKQNLLYLQITQAFTFFFLPVYTPRIRLTTNAAVGVPANGAAGKLRYFITAQEDLYQTTEWLKFLVPWIGAPLLVAWQLFATLLSVVGAVVLAPVSWLDVRSGEVKGSKDL
ncbi:hypothetical protein VdG2_01227 [Verticillium dahliae VDG2]|nr:hypothetical protein VdG2_01227 [Verticillium dahliae VDG2]